MNAPSQIERLAIVGLQWGDEGKGKLIDLHAADYDAVVRYNGGANAGHSVVIAGVRYAFHLTPSGLLRPGVLAIIANGVVVDPEKLLQELEDLASKGIDVSGLRLSSRAHVVLDHHKTEDAVRESLMAGDDAGEAIGTTRRGIGPAYADKAHRSTAVRVEDLLDRKRLAEKLNFIIPAKNRAIAAFDHDATPADPDAIVERFAAFGDRLRDAVTDTTYLLHELIRSGKRILFEGANATLLDVDHGTFPYVTSSNCSVLGIPAGTGVPGRAVQRVLGVAKAYCTRVGGGPFPTELHDDTAERIRKRGNEYGTTTGRPRRCGWLDLVALRYACMINGADGVAIMLLDVLSGFDELRVCTAYEINGERTDRFTPDAATLARATPVYETVPGFDGDITGARSLTDLPAGARAYLDRIAEFIETPIDVVSIGPDREQTIRP